MFKYSTFISKIGAKVDLLKWLIKRQNITLSEGNICLLKTCTS